MKSLIHHRTAFLLLWLAIIAMSACNTNEPDMSQPDVTVSPFDWHAVPQSGCTLELGDISLTVPENTFSKDTKISVTKMKTGSYYGAYEASGFYYITVPPKVNQSISVKLTPNKKGANVQYTALAPFHRKSSNEDVIGGIELECSYDNGECTVKLPTSNNDNDGSDLWIIVGLVEDKSSSASSEMHAAPKMTDLTVTPAGQVKNVKWHYTVDTWYWLTRSDAEAAKMNQLTDSLTPVIADALNKIHDLGFVLDEERNIPICFIRDPKKKENYGNFCQNRWSDAKSTVELNLSALENSDDPKVWGRTCIHEILHYFQANYDKRWPIVKEKGKEEDILNEAAAVWVEQFMNDGLLDAPFVGAHIVDFLRGYKTSQNGAKWSEQGYGMSAMLYYLTNPISGQDAFGITKKSIVELFQIWKDNAQYRGTSYATLNKWFADHGSYFMDIYYDDFLLAVLTGKVFDLVKGGKGEISGFDGRGNVYSFNGDRSHTYPTRTCLGFGCAIDKGIVSERTSFAGKEIIIKQDKPGVKTYLIVGDNKYKYAYYKTPATLDNPLVLPGEEIEKLIPGSHITDFYFVTINTYDSKKDFTVTCTVQDKKEDNTVPKITGIFLQTELEVGADEESSYSFYALKSFDHITMNKTTTGYTVVATNDDGDHTLSLEVNTSGATPVISQMTMNIHRSYENVSATLTDVPCTSKSKYKQFFQAYGSENNLHFSSFSYSGPLGTFDHVLNIDHSYVEVTFYID